MRDSRWFRSFRTNRGAVVGLVLVTSVIVLAFLGPHLAPRAPNEQFASGLSKLGIPAAPGGEFLLGADGMGRDELSRLLHGGRVSLEVALTATAIALVLGLLVGIVSGYFGGWIDTLAMRTVDVLLSLPFLLLAIAINRALAKTGLATLYLLLGFFSWPALARVTRAKVQQVRQLEYVAAARALGAQHPRILLRHVLPNVIGPAIVLGTGMVADMIIVESAMSFLGLGVQPPQASWGSMLHDGREFMSHAPHLLVVPAVLITMTVFGFNLLGEGLRDALDPRR
ncbi:MAG TPA: ABC transporter permease [Polyangiales bacterium]|nr:ABC transporter permease [Polyangiales bacterium]